MRKILLIVILLFCLPLAFRVRASLLRSVTEDIKLLTSSETAAQIPAVPQAGVLNASPNTEIVIQSSLGLAEDGDLNSNGQVDPGDAVQFSYTITNPTDTSYPQATLDTHIPRDVLNFIHDVQGSASLIDDGKTISIPYISLWPHQTQIISFKARATFNSDADVAISTEPELFLPEQSGPVQNIKPGPKTKFWKAAKKEIVVKKNNKFESSGQIRSRRTD